MRIYMVILICLTYCIGSQRGMADDRAELQGAIEAATLNSADKNKVDALLDRLPKTSKGYFVVDGDLLHTEEEIRGLLETRKKAIEKGSGPIPEAGELILNVLSNVPTCYRTSEERRLTYAVDENSFASAPLGAGKAIAQIFATAAAEWVNACPECNIGFEFNNNPEPKIGEVSFIIRYDGDQNYIAAAFFPNWIQNRKIVSIANEFYTSGFDQVGVLRHEIGHILGYRHEHTRPEAPFQCGFEDNSWQELTDYDDHSTMHYLCGGRGSPTLALTQKDIAGHRKAYLTDCTP